MYENGVTYQYISEVTVGANTTVATLPAGSVAIANAAGTLKTDAITATQGKFRVVQKLSNGQIIYSPFFEAADYSARSEAYAAATEQVSYFGYNGTSGDLGSPTVGELYTLSVLLRTTAPATNTKGVVKTVPYKAEAATQLDLAGGLLDSFNRTFSPTRLAYGMIKGEQINSGTGVDLDNTTAATGDLTVVKGSKTITAATDATAGGDLVAGGLIRIGLTTTSPVYLITAVDGTAETITIDTAYQGESATIGDDASQLIVAGSIGDFGLKFTGIDRFASITFNPQTDFYSKTAFSISGNDTFDSDVVFTTATAASTGTGTYPQVAQAEVKQGMNDGVAKFQQAYPAPVFRSEATDGNTYDTFVVEASDKNYTSATTGQQPVSKYTFVIRTLVALTGDGLNTVLVTDAV